MATSVIPASTAETAAYVTGSIGPTPNRNAIDRDDLTLSFKPVTFRDPDETMMLPESIESMTVVRTGLQSTRRTQVFSNYRRFLTSGRIK